MVLGDEVIIQDSGNRREYESAHEEREVNMIDEKQSEPNVGNSELRNRYRFCDDIFY